MKRPTRKMSPRREMDRWNLLSRQYQDRGLVLVVGAGISTASNLPGWKEMLLRVGDECWGEGGREKVEKLLAAGMTLPAVAGVLQSESGNSAALFQRRLKKALYRDFPFREQALQPKARAEQMRRLVDYVHGKTDAAGRNTTLAAVAALCVKRSPQGLPERNPQIHAVVTSNVDALLRTYARARYGQWLFGTVEAPGRTRRVGKLPTYYMHGYLRFYSRAWEGDDEVGHCVFTEEEYFDFFNRPYSVFNYTFLHFLREYPCLFVGMSMQDLNVRRLLHYSTAEVRGSSQLRATRSGLRHFAILKRPDDQELERLTEISLRRIGTRTLWIDDFEEVADRLGKLYGPDWNSVYALEPSREGGAAQPEEHRASAVRRASSSKGAAR